VTEANPRKVKTTPFRMSHPHVLEVRVNDDGKKRYELGQLHPPGTDLTPYKAALKAAMIAKFGDDKSKWPKLKRGPNDVFIDFATYNKEAKKPLAGDWTGWTLIRANASEQYPPTVVGPTKGPNGKFPIIADKREVYGGRWARATIEAFAYDRNDGKGVTFGLLNVQVLKHDTSFSGAIWDPNKDFENADEEWAGDDDFDKGAEKTGTASAPKSGDDDSWD